MFTAHSTGEKFFFFGNEHVEDAIKRRSAYCEYTNSWRLPDRVAKYEARGFKFYDNWETEWNEWAETRPESEWGGSTDSDSRIRVEPDA